MIKNDGVIMRGNVLLLASAINFGRWSIVMLSRYNSKTFVREPPLLKERIFECF